MKKKIFSWKKLSQEVKVNNNSDNKSVTNKFVVRISHQLLSWRKESDSQVNNKRTNDFCIQIRLDWFGDHQLDQIGSLLSYTVKKLNSSLCSMRFDKI